MENTNSGISRGTTPTAQVPGENAGTRADFGREGNLTNEQGAAELVRPYGKSELESQGKDAKEFADEVFDTALAKGEDEAFEMLARDDADDEEDVQVDSDKDTNELYQEGIVEESEGSITEFDLKEEASDKEAEGMDMKVAELQGQVNYLLTENKDLAKRVGDLEISRRNTAVSLEALLEELRAVLEEERRKKEESNNALVLLIQFMARMVEAMLAATVTEVESTANGGKRPVEKQAA